MVVIDRFHCISEIWIKAPTFTCAFYQIEAHFTCHTFWAVIVISALHTVSILRGAQLWRIASILFSKLKLSRFHLAKPLVRHQLDVDVKSILMRWSVLIQCEYGFAAYYSLWSLVSDNPLRTKLFHDDVIKHFPCYWPFVRGIHRSPVNSPHKGQWRGALMFSLICTRIKGWVNNGEAGDLRRHRAHYDVTVMSAETWNTHWGEVEILHHRRQGDV